MTGETRPAGRPPGAQGAARRTWKDEFRAFHAADPARLHFAAHSHHYWPDVTLEAHTRAWLDAARLADGKWEAVLGELLPACRDHVARVLGLASPETVVFAPNTHELVCRLHSCFERRPVAILTTDGEFHSFARQSRRWEEAGEATVRRVPTEPCASFGDRFVEAAADPGAAYDWVFVSQVFFDSGLVFERFAELAEAIPDPTTFLTIDGYHGFMARPTDLGAVESRVFYLAGGYKYAMAGEGACFMHCPPGYGPRPVDTGWYAGFGELEGDHPADGAGASAGVAYADDGSRFLGSTFDPTGLYRFNASLGRWHQLGVTVEAIHRHVVGLQSRFLAAVEAGRAGPLRLDQLIPPPEIAERGHFLTFRRPDAAGLQRRLAERGVVTDVRADRLRLGFAPYHDEADVDALADRLAAIDQGGRLG